MSHHPERTARNVRPVNQPPSYLNFCLIFVLRLWYHPQRLKVLLFAGARDVAGGLDFQS